jgi:hypothetical protein
LSSKKLSSEINKNVVKEANQVDWPILNKVGKLTVLGQRKTRPFIPPRRTQRWGTVHSAKVCFDSSAPCVEEEEDRRRRFDRVGRDQQETIGLCFKK